VPLLATLKHPLTRGGMRQGDFRRYVRALERVALRGPRPAGGLDGLIGRLRAWPADEPWTAPVPREELLAWLVRLREAARPFHALAAAEAAPFAALLEAHLALAEWLASDETGDAGELWAKAAGACAHEFVSELREAARDFGLVPKGAYPAMLAVLMGTHAVRPRAPRHPRLQILGQLESRLVQAELVLIGGLNEGVWPHGAEAGPWLSRPMRRQLGLPPVELQIGIAAHDFLAAATAPEVVLSRSRKDETGAPTTPCRWLARLDAVLRSLGLRGRVTAPPEWSAWTEALDAPRGPPRPTGRPRPCPPLAARPRELSVTAVERLMRDPYEIYASRILRLRALDPLDADPGAIQRGELIHAALEHFVRQHPTTLPPEPYETLLEIGRALFHARADRPQVMGIWWPRFLGIARWFVIQEQARRAEIVEVRAEIEGTMILDAPGGEFRIRARADRLEACRGGHVRLIDYKTGTLPKASDIRTGLKPQLPLEAAIVAAGGFKGLAATKLAEVALWGLKGGDVGGETLDPTLNYSKCVVTPAELAVQAIAGVTRLVAWFDNPATPYIAVPRPEIAPDRSDYDHLSRIAEWHGTEAEA
jgi:ATP-dependent helicase/nuclease subunit B